MKLKLEWYFLGCSGQLTSVKCAEAMWFTKSGWHSALSIMCVFVLPTLA